MTKHQAKGRDGLTAKADGGAPGSADEVTRQLRMTIHPSRPNTQRAASVKLFLVRGDAADGLSPKDIINALAGAPIQINLHESIALGHADRKAGRMSGLELCGWSPVASIQWTDAAARLLHACHVRNDQAILTFTASDGVISATLAPPLPTT